MKNLKKVLAFALAFVMVLGVVLPAVQAAGETDPPAKTACEQKLEEKTKELEDKKLELGEAKIAEQRAKNDLDDSQGAYDEAKKKRNDLISKEFDDLYKDNKEAWKAALKPLQDDLNVAYTALKGATTTYNDAKDKVERLEGEVHLLKLAVGALETACPSSGKPGDTTEDDNDGKGNTSTEPEGNGDGKDNTGEKDGDDNKSQEIKLTFQFDGDGLEKEDVVKIVKKAEFDFSEDGLFTVDGYKLINSDALKGKTPAKDTTIVLKYKKIDNSGEDDKLYVVGEDKQVIDIDEIPKVDQNATALPLIICNNSPVTVTVEVHNDKHQIQGDPYVIPAGGKAVTEPFAIGTKLYVIPTNPDANIWKDIATQTVTIKGPKKMEVYRKDANGKFETYGYKYINTNSVAFKYVRLGLNEENPVKPVKDVNKTNKVQGKAPVKVAKGKAFGNNPSTGDPSMIGYVVTTVVAAAAAFATKKNYK